MRGGIELRGTGPKPATRKKKQRESNNHTSGRETREKKGQ